MRKAARRRDEQWAYEVFDRAPFVTVSMIRPDGTPYGLPLSLVRKDERTFYFSIVQGKVRRLIVSR